ncbi:MAG: hypothetical protein ACOC8F_01460 [Planctomycetota bacterium]
MSWIPQDELKELLTHEAPHSVCLYMPAAQAGPRTRENPIRFKNLLRDARDQLELESDGLRFA